MTKLLMQIFITKVCTIVVPQRTFTMFISKLYEQNKKSIAIVIIDSIKKISWTWFWEVHRVFLSPTNVKLMLHVMTNRVETWTLVTVDQIEITQ